MTNIEKIRAALKNRATAEETMAALAALAELERAAAEPVAWMWNDELGIPHASAGSKKPVWLESSASAEYIKQANLRPLYAAPPAPAARIAELERERNSLRDFANDVMESWPHGDVDGYDLERMAVEHGLLALKDPKPTEPCCDNCACSSYPSPEEWADGIDCYVRTPLLKGDAARAGNGGGV